MKKKLLVLIICLISIFSLVGCAEKNEKGQKFYKVCNNITFVEVAKKDCYDILVHEETKVMYIRYNKDYRAGLSVMLDENGKPLLWKGK